MDVRFGVHAGLQHTSIAELRELWARIETLGFEWISIWDHFYAADATGDPHCLEAVTTHAALAAATSDVLCGSLVYSAGYRHPAVLANTMATLDQIADGRVVLGLGGGWLEQEYQVYGLHYGAAGERLRMLGEYVQCVRGLLTQERTSTVYQAYVDQLKTKTPVRVMLEPPRQKVAVAGSPSRGPATAPIEMIEFSDFQCPFCLRAHPTVNQVLSTYGDRVKLVYRHYPLPNHPNARPAAEASQCAAEQGQFWQYYDRLFADQTKLSDEGLKQSAAALGMNTGQFNVCFDTHKYKDQVEADIKDGNDAGVSGTPAFFINGRMITGAQPFEAFKRIIDEELELKKK